MQDVFSHLVNRWGSWQTKVEQGRYYKVFHCPSCGQKLRVPRGKGKIKISCRQCGANFEKKT